MAIIRLFTIDGIKNKQFTEQVIVNDFQSLQNEGELYFITIASGFV